MPSTPLEDYALIGDRHSAALVSRNGSIDWLCLPRFDSDACFASLLGTPDHGRWCLAPASAVKKTTRTYRDGTLILETRHETETGTVLVLDFMRPREDWPNLVRIVRGEKGAVEMRMDLVLRFGYGIVVPWVKKVAGGLQAVAGPDRVQIATPVEMRGEGMKTVADFTVREGEEVPFVLAWSPSHTELHPPPDAAESLERANARWTEWSGAFQLDGPHEEIVRRSLVTLKALTYAPTGGILAAPTTSLPERLGGSRNWDYRFCWLRDATFTLYAFLSSGYREEAAAWRDWLLRAVAGQASQLQTLYGLAGERRIEEKELVWLDGYEKSKPVRIGNAASEQLQLDVWGEVMDALYLARRMNLPQEEDSWSLQTTLMDHLEKIWREPDAGIWEVRGPRLQFTHSKVMAWVAFDRAVKSIEQFGLPGPLARWQGVREEIHALVCREAFDEKRGSFVQSFGGASVDASLLMIPLVGFLPADDPRIIGTVKAIEHDLLRDGFVARYAPTEGFDGQHGDEGVFLPCSFWLVDNLVLQGRKAEAHALFDRLIALANDVGLLAEEYDVRARRLVGNFPQAFSHVSLVNSARNLSPSGGPAHHRPDGPAEPSPHS
jgi:GH15 family glucan-1,4-alpha-glucosidase